MARDQARTVPFPDELGREIADQPLRTPLHLRPERRVQERYTKRRVARDRRDLGLRAHRCGAYARGPVRVLSVGNMYPPHDLRGGYELTWRSAVAHLRERDDEVRVLTSDHRAAELEPGAVEDPDVHRELRLYWRDHAFPKMGLRERIALERHNAAALDRHLAELRPDVVNWWGMGSLSLGLIERVRRAGIPAVGVVGDEWMLWGPRADGWTRAFRRSALLGRAADRLTGLPTRPDLGAAAVWLFNSDHVRRKMRASVELPRAEVAHPGIDDGLFQPAPERPWGWRLLYLGRLDRRKGVDLAVDALERLPDEATLTLQGTGDDDYVGELRERAVRLGGRLAFSAEPRERLADVYAAADVLVFPVRWEEPWGLVPLEAMAVGRPVVATGTGGSGEYLRDGQNCLVVARDDPVALAGAVERLAGDPGLRARLRGAGLATAAQFTERAYNETIAAALEQATVPA